MQRTLLDATLRVIRPQSFVLYLYGSSAYSAEPGRDIDLVMITRDGEECAFYDFPFDGHGATRSCNLYCVPEPVFHSDVETLAYGGYYSHKFAFSFERLASEGELPDPARHFWTSEYARYRTHHTGTVAADDLIQFVHNQIFEYQPSVARSLSLFLESKEGLQRLKDFVGDCLQSVEWSASENFDLERFRSRQRESLFRFWMEYSKYKGGGTHWSAEVRQKMIKSLGEAQMRLIVAHLGHPRTDRPD